MGHIIFNADDFGMTEGINYGIIACHDDGVVNSTTLMINMPYTTMAAQMAKTRPLLGVGLHLNLTCGRPLLEKARSFVDKNGDFLRPDAYPINVDPDELYDEWDAQIQAFKELFGHLPTHLDSHHHVHLRPEMVAVTLKLAEKYHLPIRQRTRLKDPYHPLISTFYGDHAGMDFFPEHDLEKESYEIMCHPAFLDQRLLDMSSYAMPRAREMAILRSPELKAYLKEHDLISIHY